MRHGFGLPQVLLIILFVGGIVTVTMRYASLGAQHYADSYTREQAELFMQSATEAALLRLSAFDRSSGHCMQDVNISLPSKDGTALFYADVIIHKYYLSDGTGCIEKDINGDDLNETIQTEESNGMIDMSVVVRSNNSNPKILHPIRLERRSLQRP
jgi:hypothetical protein